VQHKSKDYQQYRLYDTLIIPYVWSRQCLDLVNTRCCWTTS